MDRHKICFSAKRETNKGGEGCPPKQDIQNDIQNIQVTFENTMGYQPEQPVKKPIGKKARRAAKEAAEAAARAVEAEENEAKNFKPRYLNQTNGYIDVETDVGDKVPGMLVTSLRWPFDYFCHQHQKCLYYLADITLSSTSL